MTSAATVKLNAVLAESKVESDNPSVSNRLRVRLNCKGVEKRPETNEKRGATKYYIRRSGQFVYGRQNLHKGAFGVVPENLDGFESSADIPAFDVAPSCKPAWIDLFLKQGGYYRELERLASGVGSKRISPKKFLDLEIPLPSLEQQEKTLRKVEELRGMLDQLVNNLIGQESQSANLRQQILQEAIQGRLTTDWRSANPDVEPAKELLNRIAAEKADLVKAKKIKKQKQLSPINKGEEPFDLPEGWEWCRLGETTYGFQYGTSSKSHETGDVPVLRMGNLQNAKIDWNGLVYSSDPDEIAKFELKAGDLLFNRTNSRELVGKTAIFDGLRQAIYAGYLVRFRMAGGANPRYANLVMNSALHRNWCDEVKTDAIGQSNINATKLSLFMYPLPPIDEQQAIVDRAEKLLIICGQLEYRIRENQTHANALMQAVLSEAFTQGSQEAGHAQ